MTDAAKASKAVEQARARRTGRAAADAARIEWFINDVCQRVQMPLRARVKLATTFLMNKIVLNLSKPVVKAKGKSGHVYVLPSSRSRPGEFPRADTTQLMKTIFTDYREPADGAFAGYVGTPLSYGLELELVKNRRFLVRTLNEERDSIMKILTGPIR